MGIVKYVRLVMPFMEVSGMGADEETFAGEFGSICNGLAGAAACCAQAETTGTMSNIRKIRKTRKTAPRISK